MYADFLVSGAGTVIIVPGPVLWDIYDDERMGGDCHRHRAHFPASTHHNGDDGDGGHKVVPVDLCPLDADQDLGAGQVEDGHFLVQTPSS